MFHAHGLPIEAAPRTDGRGADANPRVSSLEGDGAFHWRNIEHIRLFCYFESSGFDCPKALVVGDRK